ncbi:8217_t:CDS:10, partial [Racocetra persica]
MSNKRVYKRTAKNWSIVNFLNKSIKEPFKHKIDSYLKSIQIIIDSEQGERADRAKILHDNYKRASKAFLFKILEYVAWQRICSITACLSVAKKTTCLSVAKKTVRLFSTGPTEIPYRTASKEKYMKKQVHIYQPNLNAGTVINEINSGTLGSINSEAKITSKKRGYKAEKVVIYFEKVRNKESKEQANSKRMFMCDYKKYKKSYTKLDDSNKWKLTTRTVVEDALYAFGLHCKYEHLAHLFVLDPDNDTYLKENVFTKIELCEIRQFQVKEMLLMSLDLVKYINSFNLKTTSEIRKQIFSPDQIDQDFNRLRDFDRDWIRNTIHNLLQEYESNTLTKDHLELWILVHIWSFTDKVFNNIEKVKVVRGESCSLLSSAQKNRKRTMSRIANMKRKVLGKRGNMIIRKIIAEFGCAEAGRQFESENGTKLLHERGFKISKVMKDMFKYLYETFNQDDYKTCQLEMIGFLHT